MKKRNSQRSGLTLIELIVAFTLMLVLSTMAVPLARSRVHRNRERELRLALDEIRKGIDKYKDRCDAGQLGIQKQDAQCYPENLDAMVEGVKGSGPNADVKLKFLRRIPIDPLTKKREWGVRSMQDDPKGQGGGGQNVFDIFTKSSEKAGDGTPYSEW